MDAKSSKKWFGRILGNNTPQFKALEILRFIGPGLLVTVGFIDPGNWASNIAAGSDYGYSLLWMVTLSTILLILLQHNSAHLGIVTGLCLSEAASAYLRPSVSKIVLLTSMLASIATLFAEILGAAIALNMLVGLPLKLGALFSCGLVLFMLLTNSYKKLEKWIIGFVSIIGFSFLFELFLVDVEWNQVFVSWVTPSFPPGSMIVIMSVLGAVVMPHNLFLHSEVIQSRQWNLSNEAIIKKQLKYEFVDTLFSMILGWVINSAIIIIAASTFFKSDIHVTELSQAALLLGPLLGKSAAVIFAVALLFSGIASSVTAGMASGTISAGLFNEPYDIKDKHTRIGVILTLLLSTIAIFFITNPMHGLIISQMLLSIQLPITIFLQLYLTSSKRVMGKYANSLSDKLILWTIFLVVTVFNVILFINLLR